MAAGTRSTIDAANHGLDIAMPGPPSRPDYFGAPLLAAIKAGLVSEATITEKAVRIVYSLAAVGALDSVNQHNSSNDVTSDAHRALARSIAAQSAILLRNAPVPSAPRTSTAAAAGGIETGAQATAAAAPLLPLDLQSHVVGGGHSIALIGLAAKDAPLYGGGGSGSVRPKAPVSIYQALAAKLGVKPAGQVVVDCQVVANDTDFFISGGVHVQPINATPAGCCQACGADGGKWVAFTSSGSRCWCHPAGEVERRAHTGYTSGTCRRLQPPAPPAAHMPLTYSNGKDTAAAMKAAKAASVAIVVLAQTSHEGADRTTLTLGQSELVANISAANPRTVVLTISPGPFLTPWRESIAALVDFGFPGEQEGNAAVDVLFGDVSPSGKLPHTMPNIENEMQMTARQYPGLPPPPDASGDGDTHTQAMINCGNPVPTLPSGLNPQGGTVR